MVQAKICEAYNFMRSSQAAKFIICPKKPWQLTPLPKASLGKIWTWKILLKYIQIKIFKTQRIQEWLGTRIMCGRHSLGQESFGTADSGSVYWLHHKGLQMSSGKQYLAPSVLTSFSTVSRSGEMDAKNYNSASLKVWTSQSTSVRLPRCHRPDDIPRYKIHL